MLAVVAASINSVVFAAELSKSEKDFFHNTAIDGMTEVKLGEVAAKNGADQQVKDFGNKMVKEHSKCNEELKKLATSKGITLPTDLDGKHQSVLDNYSKLKGAKFDHDFMDLMISDHKKVASSLKSEEKTTDADLKQWCKTTLPMVEEHLKLAQDIDKKIDKK